MTDTRPELLPMLLYATDAANDQWLITGYIVPTARGMRGSRRLPNTRSVTSIRRPLVVGELSVVTDVPEPKISEYVTEDNPAITVTSSAEAMTLLRDAWERERRITLVKVAKRLEKSISSVTMWLKNSRMPSAQTFFELANVMGFDVVMVKRGK